MAKIQFAGAVDTRRTKVTLPHSSDERQRVGHTPPTKRERRWTVREIDEQLRQSFCDSDEEGRGNVTGVSRKIGGVTCQLMFHFLSTVWLSRDLRNWRWHNEESRLPPISNSTGPAGPG